MPQARDPGVYLAGPTERDLDEERKKRLHDETLWLVKNQFGEERYVLGKDIREASARFEAFGALQNNPSNNWQAVSARAVGSIIVDKK